MTEIEETPILSDKKSCDFYIHKKVLGLKPSRLGQRGKVTHKVIYLCSSSSFMSVSNHCILTSSFMTKQTETNCNIKLLYMCRNFSKVADTFRAHHFSLL